MYTNKPIAEYHLLFLSLFGIFGAFLLFLRIRQIAIAGRAANVAFRFLGLFVLAASLGRVQIL